MEFSAPNAMPPSPDFGSALHCLAEIASVNTDFERFFGGVLDELESLLGQLLHHEKELQDERQRMEQQLEWRRAELERQKAEMEALRRSLLEDIRGEVARAAVGSEVLDQRLTDWFGRAGEERATLASALRDFQAQVTHLVQAKSELAHLTCELNRGLEQLAQAQATAQSQAWPAMEERLRRAEREKAELDRDRTALEAELETLRGRMAEMARMLDQQKHQVTEERTLWGDEIRRLRQLVEAMSGGLGGTRTSRGAVSGPTAAGDYSNPAAPEIPGGPDTVLDAVVAQFELLQKEAARRRKRLLPAEQDHLVKTAP